MAAKPDGAVPPREDFAAVTAHALDYALAALGLQLADADARPTCATRT